MRLRKVELDDFASWCMSVVLMVDGYTGISVLRTAADRRPCQHKAQEKCKVWRPLQGLTKINENCLWPPEHSRVAPSHGPKLDGAEAPLNAAAWRLLSNFCLSTARGQRFRFSKHARIPVGVEAET